MQYQEFIESIERDLKAFSQKLLQASEILAGDLDYEVAQTPADVVYSEGKMKLLHYHRNVKKNRVHGTPVLIVYALINRHIMLDLEPGRSFVQNLLNEGLDIYIIDWGYPTGADRYLTLDDYLNYYLDKAVEQIKTDGAIEKINLMGVCMGGTFNVIYTALHPEKVKNLITLATPTDFDIDDALLFLWAKKFDVDKIVDVLGNLPGDLANYLYLLVTPVDTVNKYVRFVDNIENKKQVSTFLRMEKWIFDSPDMSGAVFREYIGKLFQKNLLIKNRLRINDQKVDLKNIRCPLLNVYGKNDYLAPPASSKPLAEAVGSKDTKTLEVDTGHVGIFVGSRSYKTICPRIVEWIRTR